MASENILFSELSTHNKLLCKFDLDLLVTASIHLAAADYTPGYVDGKESFNHRRVHCLELLHKFPAQLIKLCFN
jgi:hypothetical protein